MTTPTTAEDEHFVTLARYWEKKFDLLLIERDALAQQVEALTHEVDVTQLAFEHWRDECVTLTAERDKYLAASDNGRPIEHEYSSYVAFALALEVYCTTLESERNALKAAAEREKCALLCESQVETGRTTATTSRN